MVGISCPKCGWTHDAYDCDPAEMEQSPKQSPVAVEPVADLIERLKDRRGNRALLCAEAATSLSQLSTKLEEAKKFVEYVASYPAWGPSAKFSAEAKRLLKEMK